MLSQPSEIKPGTNVHATGEPHDSNENEIMKMSLQPGSWISCTIPLHSGQRPENAHRVLSMKARLIQKTGSQKSELKHSLS